MWMASSARKTRLLSIGTLAVCLGGTLVADSADKPRDVSAKPQLRHPVALVRHGDHLLVGNRRSGTISLIDVAAQAVVAEQVVAARIADMTSLGDERGLLVVDDLQQRAIRVLINQGVVDTQPLVSIPRGARKIICDPRGARVFVSCSWAHSVAVLTFDPTFDKLRHKRTIAVPFVPRELVLLNDGRTLLVADAFGGRIAVLDLAEQRVQSVRRIDGHNIRGLALSHDGKLLHVAHQRMARRGRADYEELHWGRLVSNAVEVFDLDRLLAHSTDTVTRGWMDAQGGIGDATGDPGGVITGPEGFTATTFSGMGEVAVRYGGYLKRLRVQRRPEAMLRDGQHVYVANRFDDSLSVIDLRSGTVVRTIALGPRPELDAVSRGERLFFDARLSHDAWISCHSCHTDGHSSGLLVDTLGDGDYGAPKRVPSLLGTGGTGPWGWTGGVQSLSEQVRKSVTTTMHGAQLSDRQTSDLVAYLKTLRMPASPHVNDPELIGQGRAVFAARGCARCHSGSHLTSDAVFNVGLADERGRSAFNPPSLRGLSHRATFFHDGRVDQLQHVLRRVRHMLDEPLSDADSQALLAYLRSL